jgi:hypothetical protein
LFLSLFAPFTYADGIAFAVNMLIAYIFSFSIRYQHVIFKKKDGLHVKEKINMALSLPFYQRMSGQPDVRSAISMPMPMVYEDAPLKPTTWEYRVLTIDTREEALPDAALLNDLGKEGWLLVGVLDLHAQASTSLVHYYFVRQKME